jgi:hypothetical protein
MEEVVAPESHAHPSVEAFYRFEDLYYSFRLRLSVLRINVPKSEIATIENACSCEV